MVPPFIVAAAPLRAVKRDNSPRAVAAFIKFLAKNDLPVPGPPCTKTRNGLLESKH